MSDFAAINLMQCPIAGFQHHAGESCWARLKPRDRLVLRREPGNRHDPRAIAVEWQDVTLGYVPREANFALSQMMDRGAHVEARVRSLRDGPGPWDRVMMEVAVVAAADRTPAPQPPPQPEEHVILAPGCDEAITLIEPHFASRKLGTEQQALALKVLGDLVPRIAHHLTKPLRGVRTAYGREVHLWGAAVIEIGPDGRGLRSRFLGAPAHVMGPATTLDLKWPLKPREWPSSLSPVIAAACDSHGLDKDAMSEPFVKAIRDSLVATFEDFLAFEELRRAALEFLAPDPLARSLTNRIVGPSASAEAFNWVCGRVPAIALCAVEHPGMLPFLRVAFDDKAMKLAADPLAALRERLLHEGLEPAAWKKMDRWGFEAFESLGRASWQPIPIARFANLLHRLGVKLPPPDAFAGLALEAAMHRLPPNHPLDFERHSLWFMRALLDETEDMEGTEGQDLLSVAAPLAVDWLLDARPVPDANQKHAGWTWIMQQAWQHHDAGMLARMAPWPVPIEEMAWPPYRVVAIRSAAELLIEGKAMKNCLANYEDACRSGDVLVFSIRELPNLQRLACFAAQRIEGTRNWEVLEVAGKMNSAAGGDMERIAEAMVVKLNGGRGGKVAPF